MNALLLNADYQPLKVIAWERALALIWDEQAELVQDYVGKVVRTVSTAFPWPAVVRLKKFAKHRLRVRFNRANLLARDGYQCQYCGERPMRQRRPALEELTLDHVIPRAHSTAATVKTAHGKIVSVTCWENIVCACMDCNHRKGARTPEQAGMKLRTVPRAPNAADSLRMSLTKVTIPEEWREYLPEGAADWKHYWTEELASD